MREAEQGRRRERKEGMMMMLLRGAQTREGSGATSQFLKRRERELVATHQFTLLGIGDTWGQEQNGCYHTQQGLQGFAQIVRITLLSLLSLSSKI